MVLPIRVQGSRAIIKANPGAAVVSVLDRWLSHGYIATIGELNGYYVLHKVIYNVSKVPMEKIYEIAKGIEDGSFDCPTCQKMASEQAQEVLYKPEKPVVEPPKSETKMDERASEPEVEKVVTPPEPIEVTPTIERAKVVEPIVTDDYEPIDEEDATRHERERRIQTIINQMDDILLLSSFQ